MPSQREDEPWDYLHTSRLPQRRRLATPRRSASRHYYRDEHPEIPSIRRASVHFNEIENQLPVSSEQPGKPSLTSRVKMKHSEQRESAKTTVVPSNEQPQATGKIVVERLRRQTIYEPPYTHYHIRKHGRQQPRTMLSYLQDASHNRTVILTATLVLIGLLLLPLGITVALNASHTQPDMGTYAVTRSVGSQGSSTGIVQPIQPADPYELVIVPEDTDHPAPPVFATAAYLLDANTGATLYAHNPFLHLPMLSTTKLMTAILALEKGNLDQRVTINDQIAQDINQLSADSSLMGIKKGETYTLRQLLYGLLLVSGNDAAVAIADDIGGSLPKFVAMMNQKAHDLGLYNTHYMNPHGLLQTGHYSSAHDLALLGLYAMNIPALHTISGTKTYEIPATADHPEHMLINGNQFLWWYPGVDGGKPGWDGDKDFIQVISCTRNGHHLIGVTMNTINWWTDMRDLMNWGFDNFNWVSPYDADISNPPIPYDYEWNYFISDKKTNTIPTANQGRYYIYTGYDISGLIMAYFDKNGGLNHFGYPTSMLQVAKGTVIQQKFEHATIQCDSASKYCKAI